jgi:3'-5' exoribonuclease
MLHYLDDLDSKMESMRAHFGREPEAEWTTYNSSLERPLLNSKKFLEKMKAGNGIAAAEPQAAPPAAAQSDAEAQPGSTQPDLPQHQSATAIAGEKK